MQQQQHQFAVSHIHSVLFERDDDKKTNRQIDTDIDRQRDRISKGKRNRQTERQRQRDRKTENQRYREEERNRQVKETVTD